MIHLKSPEFLGKVVIQEPKTAIGEAKKDVSDLALWSDGSKLESGGAGAAVVWKNSTSYRWDVRKVSLGKNEEILDAEL